MHNNTSNSLCVTFGSTCTVASSPGHTHFSMLHADNIEKWVWPGDEATCTVLLGKRANLFFLYM